MIRCQINPILARRKHNGQTPSNLSELARAAGLTRATVSNLANSKTKRYDAHTISAICQALGVGVGDILVYVGQ